MPPASRGGLRLTSCKALRRLTPDGVSMSPLRLMWPVTVSQLIHAIMMSHDHPDEHPHRRQSFAPGCEHLHRPDDG